MPREEQRETGRFPTTSETSRRMGRVRRSGTDLEQTVAAALRKLGYHFRRNVRELPGTPDFAHKGMHKAIFVNGCYWHGHGGGCPDASTPRRNRKAWLEKRRRNRIRDQRKADELRHLGFEVLTIWGCETKVPEVLLGRLESFVEGRTAGDRSGGADGASPEREQPPESYAFDYDTGELTRRVRDGDRSVNETRAAPVGTVDDGDFAAAFDQSWLRNEHRPEYESSASHGIVRIVDLFSGCGGMTLGVAEAGRALGLSAQVLLAADVNRDALEIYSQNLNPERIEDTPIQEWLDGEIGDEPSPGERNLKATLGKVDVLLGGPPCQGHSNLNNHTRRNDQRNELYTRMARFAEIFRPTHIIVENVPGVVYDRNGVFLRTVKALERLQYRTDFGVVRAEDLGVPQTRHRVFLVASLHRTPRLEEWLRAHAVPRRSFDWACSDIPSASSNGAVDQATTPWPVTRARIDYLFDHDLYELPDDERPDCHRLKDHSYVSVYGRIRDWLPAPTITTGFTVMGQGRFVHPYLRRTLTPREGARLQFFPAWFDFGDRQRSTYLKVVGNAVPPKMVYPLAMELLRATDDDSAPTE